MPPGMRVEGVECGDPRARQYLRVAARLTDAPGRPADRDDLVSCGASECVMDHMHSEGIGHVTGAAPRALPDNAVRSVQHVRLRGIGGGRDIGPQRLEVLV